MKHSSFVVFVQESVATQAHIVLFHPPSRDDRKSEWNRDNRVDSDYEFSIPIRSGSEVGCIVPLSNSVSQSVSQSLCQSIHNKSRTKHAYKTLVQFCSVQGRSLYRTITPYEIGARGKQRRHQQGGKN
jgi:hypothetical protein